MNPLSIWTFYRRHKKRVILLLSLISLVMGALTWAIFTEPTRANNMYLSKINIVLPLYGTEMYPEAIARIRAHPDEDRMLPTFIANGIGIPEAMGGQNNWINLLALEGNDVSYILERFDANLAESQMLQPNTNGVLLSKNVAAALDVRIGDVIYNGVDLKRYSTILEPMQVVGILKSEMRLGFISYEFLRDHELYHDTLLTQFIVTARPGHELSVDNFLLDEVASNQIRALTYKNLMAQPARDYQQTMLFGLPIAVFAAIAISMVVGIANHMALAQRLPEFGILHAAGHSKGLMARRLAAETALMAATGWTTGILLSRLILYLIEWAQFTPRGHGLTVIWAPVILILPIPIVVITFTLLSALGYCYWRLVPRLLWETALTTVAACRISIALCCAGMLILQFSLFTPIGLRMNLANPIPWLFIFPIPLVVLVVTSSSVARLLSRLDPVAIVDRR